MLKRVTLAQVIKLMVEVFVDLAAGTVLNKKAPENPKAAHPNDLTIHLSEPVLQCLAWVLHTLAYEHRPYPFSYQNHGVCQFVERL
jgi:hypothetical protein